MKTLELKNSKEVIANYEKSELAKVEKKDCVVKAIAAGFQLDYDNSHKLVEEKFGREKQKGVEGMFEKINELIEKKVAFNGKCFTKMGEREIITRYNNGGRIVERTMTIGTFVVRYPKGTFLIGVSNHSFIIKDGIIIGNSDDGRSKRRINFAFEITDEPKKTSAKKPAQTNKK